MEHETRIPQAELRFQVLGSDTLIVSAFEDSVGGFDLVCGVSSIEDFDTIFEVVNDLVRHAKHLKDWSTIPSPRDDVAPF